METINNISEKFKDIVELQSFCNRQAESLQQAKIIILNLNKEVKRLKELLALKNSTEEIIKSTEQIICETQIEQLRETALERQLTLEETKRLDLLVKNLLLCKGAYKDIKPDYRTIPKGLTSEKLLEIASTASVEDV